MLGLRKIRFVDIGTGLSMMLGTAGMLVAGAISAAEPSCVPSTGCTPGCTQGAPACCDHIFADAANRINGYYAGLNCDTCAAPAVPAPTCAPVAPADGCTATGSGCTATGGSSDPWTVQSLFTDECGKNCLTDNGYKIGGSVAQSFTLNFNSPRNRWNGPVTWTDRSNEYQLNQVWLYADKPTDTSKKDWDFGGRVDFLGGTNARFTTSTGIETPNINGPGIYGIAFPQFYAEAAYKKLKVKVGHFLSPVGYFVVDTSQNFFNTLPYTYQWGEPFTHTGAVATYQFTDTFAASAGYIQGWDNLGGSNPYAGGLATWTYTFKDKSSIAHAMFLTQEPNWNFQFTQRFMQSLVYTKPINDCWTYVAQSDLGHQRDATFDGRDAYWYGLNQYLYYKINDKWTWGVNAEWWRDEEGFRVVSFLPSAAPSGITGSPNGVSGLPGGFAGNFYQITVGPRWYPYGKPNFFVRPNLRFDWFEGNIDSPPNTSPPTYPYQDGTKTNQGILATDVVWTF